MVMTVSSTTGKAAEGRMELQQTVHHANYQSLRPDGRRFEYDSEKGGSDPMLKGAIERLIGKKVTMRVDDRGRISDLDIPADFGLPGPKSLFLVLPFTLPEAPLAVGRSWEAKALMPVPEGTDHELRMTGKLVAIDKGRATIETTVLIDAEKDELPKGVVIEKYNGSAVIDLKSGRLVEERWELRFTRDQPGGKVEWLLGIKVEPIDPPSPRPVEAAKPPEPGSGKD